MASRRACGADRGVQYAMLDCGYVDAVAAHEEAIRQYMKDYGANFRILDEPLLTTGIGVAFSKNDTRGLAAQLTEVFAQMREDGSMEQLVGKYLEVPAHSLEVEQLERELPAHCLPKDVLVPVPRGGAFVPWCGIPAVPARGYAGLRAAHDRADRLCKGAVLLLCAV